MPHVATGIFQVQQLPAGQGAVRVVEARHLGAQLEGEIGVFAIGVEDQMARAASRRQFDACRLVGLQRALRVLRVVAVDEHPIGTQVADQQTLAVRARYGGMHMCRALAFGMHAARLMGKDLCDRQRVAILGQRHHRQTSARVGPRTVVADEQVAAVMAQAGMGRLIAQADVLPDQLVLAATVELPGTDTTDRVSMCRTVLIGGVEPAVLVIQHQPGGVVAGEGLHGLRVDLPGRGIEAQTQDARAVAVVRVAADENVHIVCLGSRTARQQRTDQQGESEANQCGPIAPGQCSHATMTAGVAQRSRKKRGRTLPDCYGLISTRADAGLP